VVAVRADLFSSAARFLGDPLVVAYDLGDDELEELLRELGVEP